MGSPENDALSRGPESVGEHHHDDLELVFGNETLELLSAMVEDDLERDFDAVVAERLESRQGCLQGAVRTLEHERETFLLRPNDD